MTKFLFVVWLYALIFTAVFLFGSPVFIKIMLGLTGSLLVLGIAYAFFGKIPGDSP
jgi:hypothetical protein